MLSFANPLAEILAYENGLCHSTVPVKHGFNEPAAACIMRLQNRKKIK